MTCPCGICEQRYIGCHAECAEYAAWKADKNAAFQRRATQNARRSAINAYIKGTPSRKEYLRRRKK